MRSERHEYECQIKDHLKILDSLRRDLEQNSKKLKIIDNSLNTSQQELLEFLVIINYTNQRCVHMMFDNIFLT